MSASVYSADVVCPNGAYKVSFDMDFEPRKHVFCQSKINGITVKHGPYFKFNSDDSIAEKKYYNNGNETDAVSTSKILNQLTSESANLPNLGSLLRALIPDFSSKQISEFSTKKCDVNRMKWGMLFMRKKSFKQNYHFKKDCDIEGEIEFQIDEKFPVNVKLNDFKSYTRVSMTLIMSMDKKRRLSIIATSGTLHGPKIIKFSGSYSTRVRVSSSGLEFINSGGVIDVSQIDDQKVNISQKIIIQ
jgi:hypothetical protein